ncbi:MAG: dihydrofolate reductase [Bacteroides sp.]|nr:dihydrofolate reductase [Bacteroides sp.]MCM1086387.1 dihydrofolate reductase [Bacteroides sp.]
METAQKYNLSIVVAIAANRAIGMNNDLLWHLSDDLKHFKALTSGHTIVMGRKTYESFPRRPLPNRFHIVLSGTARYEEESVKTVRTLEEALAALPAGEESFVIGGGQVFRMFLPYCRKAYITEVRKDFEADTFFPELASDQWRPEETGPWLTDGASGLEYRYVTYVRK